MATSESQKRYAATYREKNRESLREQSRSNRRKIKFEALAMYGPCCFECGITDIRVLQIDHIENNGNTERNSLGGYKYAGYQFYQWLKKRGWPQGYQTLCANHNLIKYFGEDF